MSTPDRDVLSFPRQHARTRRFTLGSPRNVTISPDGTSILFLRSRSDSDPVLCLWSLDIATSTERLLVDPTALGDDETGLSPAERARRERARESSAGIVRYTIDAAFRQAAMEIGGAVAVVDIETGELRMFPTTEGLFDARIDPTGRRCAYVADRSLRLIDLATGDDTELVGASEPLTSWGRADFIAGEEMGRTRGFWWAPDGESILANRVDEAPVNQWWIADPANPGTAPLPIRYPAAGTANASVGLFHIRLNGQRAEIPWSTANAPFEYLADVVWTDGHDPLTVRQSRDQRTVSVAAVDLETASVREVRRITDPVWVELIAGSPGWCDLGLLTIEDRADTDHRMLCLDGNPLEIGNMHVRSIVAINGSSVVVTAWTDATEIHVITIDLADAEAPANVAVTPMTSVPGVHQAVANGTVIVVTSATPEQAVLSVSVLVDGIERATIESKVATPVISAEPMFLRLGTRELAGALFLPRDHDGATALPVLLDPYGGPHAQRVLKNHLSHLTSQWFADQGFAVLVVDNRGAPGRGPAFEREVWGDLAAPVLEDQLDALDAAAERFEFLDLQRVGIRGWSFGGYLAALAALRAPDRIHAAIAGAPVTSWKLYDTHYTERYLGHPGEHPEHYQRTDLIAQAGLLERPLLLIHGLADDNVVAAHSLQFSTALLAAGRSHSVLPLSGVTHMTPQEVVAENLLHLQRDFLLEHLDR